MTKTQELVKAHGLDAVNVAEAKYNELANEVTKVIGYAVTARLAHRNAGIAFTNRVLDELRDERDAYWAAYVDLSN